MLHHVTYTYYHGVIVPLLAAPLSLYASRAAQWLRNHRRR